MHLDNVRTLHCAWSKGPPQNEDEDAIFCCLFYSCLVCLFLVILISVILHLLLVGQMRERGKFGSTLMDTCALDRNRLILLLCHRKSNTSVQFYFA